MADQPETTADPQHLDPAEYAHVFVEGPYGGENWTTQEWNGYVDEHQAAADPEPMFRITGRVRRVGTAPGQANPDPFADLVLSPAGRRAAVFLRAWAAAPVRQRRTREVISRQNPGAPDGGQELLAGDVRELVHDQRRLHELWCETERMKRIIAVLVEAIDGEESENAPELPSVAASQEAIQKLIDAEARQQQALNQARWIASEFPSDCEDGCTVVGGKCLDCGTPLNEMRSEPEDEPPVTADGWTGYTPQDLAWLARELGDTEWAAHVIGPDEIHTHVNPELGDDDPGNPLHTEATARAAVAEIRRIDREYSEKHHPSEEYRPVAHPVLLRRGIPVPVEPVRGFRVGDLVQITARDGEGEHTPPGLRLGGRTGVVTEIDDNPGYPIGLTVEGFPGTVWCNSGEIRHANAAGSVL